ncbi:hypothetical protein IW261DRAFT_1524225, partial [Armillaria novae-zelandiae]
LSQLQWLPHFTSTTTLSHEDGLLLLVAHAHHCRSSTTQVKTLAVAYVHRRGRLSLTVEVGDNKFTSKPLSGQRARAVLAGDNEIWYQQYPSYETGQVADGRVAIDFWTDDKIVAVFKSKLDPRRYLVRSADSFLSADVDNDYGRMGPGNLGLEK